MHVYSRRFPKVNIVGLPNKAIQESILSIKSAVVNSGYKFPVKKIVISLNTVEFRKNYSVYDTPIALGVLRSAFTFKETPNYLFTGILALNCSIEPCVADSFISDIAHKYDRALVLHRLLAILGQVLPKNVIPPHNLRQLINYYAIK